MLRIIVIVCGVLLGLMLAAIGLASQHNLLSSLRAMLADPWGLVTLLDLSIGLLFVAVWIAVVEPRRWRAGIWIIALFLLGNLVTLVFLLCRTCQARTIRDLFLPSPPKK